MVDLHEVFRKHTAIWHGRTHYPYQDRITKAIIDGMVASTKGEIVEIPIELPRQTGKTTSVVDVVEFLLCAWREYFGEALPVGIFAPQKEQATTDFDRLKMQYTEIAPLGFTTRAMVEGDAKFPEKWNSKTIRLYNGGKFCGECYVFPISKTSNPESKTLKLIIIEEAQLIYDEKMKRAVFPMGASTNAVRVLIGTAGTRLCYFKQQLDTNPRAIRVKLEDVFADRQRVYEQTRNPYHLQYQAFVDHEIQTNGFESDYIKTQYRNVWVIGTGQFCTTEMLDEMEDEEFAIQNTSERACYVGVDTAKSPDETVVTIVADREGEGENLKCDLVGWLSLRGENYEDQFEIITNFLEPKYEDILDEKGNPKKNRKTGEVERRLVAGFADIRAIAFDSTGQGDFMPDKFERHSAYNIIRFPFNQSSKDVLYKNLAQVIFNKLTRIPAKDRREKDYIGWRTQMLNLEKEYKGRFLSVHHPDDANAHDDYPDSWALAEYAKTECVKTEPGIRIL